MSGTLWVFQPWASNLLSGFIGAVVGGAITCCGGWLATKSAAKTAFEVQQREFEAREKAGKDAALALIRGTVQSISDEVEALWKHYNREIGPHLAALPTGSPANIFRATQSYFVIFDAAGALVGRIPNQILRSKIIDFYVGAKACVDSLQYYEGLHVSHETITDYNQKADKWREIIQYSKQLKIMSTEFSKLYDALKPELDGYLSTTRSGF
jgi:hypothetical protein